MQRVYGFVLYVLLIALVSCVSYSIQPSIQSCKLTSLIQEQIDSEINIGEFTSSTPLLSSIPCRAVGPVRTSNKIPFAHIIRALLIEELKAANRYSPEAKTTIIGHLNYIDFDSMAGTWKFTMTVKSSNGEFLTVRESFHYEPKWWGEAGCRETANAFIPAIQKLITSLITNSKFSSLL